MAVDAYPNTSISGGTVAFLHSSTGIVFAGSGGALPQSPSWATTHALDCLAVTSAIIRLLAAARWRSTHTHRLIHRMTLLASSPAAAGRSQRSCPRWATMCESERLVISATRRLSGSMVAFRGYYNADYGSRAGSGILLVWRSATTIAKIGDAVPTGTFTDFGDPSLSGSTAAFRADYNSGASSGIFTNSGESLNTIIATGDTLFGSSRVTSLLLGSDGLDESGDVAFFYKLADGRHGVAIAEVPEPSSLVVLAIGILSLAGYCWRDGKGDITDIGKLANQ